MKTLSAIAVLAVLAASCAADDYFTRARLDSIAPGVTEQELLDRMGTPDARETDDLGGTVWTYDGYRRKNPYDDERVACRVRVTLMDGKIVTKEVTEPPPTASR